MYISSLGGKIPDLFMMLIPSKEMVVSVMDRVRKDGDFVMMVLCCIKAMAPKKYGFLTLIR